ncbi:hypothetical protein OHB35_42280 [Streptomyces phaeochromogenes]|uniref:Tetratricopeptide repeat protein n=1 Tax=Streptomyces phaeochromogenes TaxID=1923 RepID=A0ABZ1HQ52_STRPH|nr:hypothetical protein [Streptomyces phaeochromogenes]WSD19345.1 hypothetical protein OHB35_42280 [Streptomyces phaeochromogenes]
MAEQQEQAAADAMMTRIGQVAMLLHGGDREEARGRFLDLWTEIGEDGDALHRCTLAHYMADAQDDPSDELAWDLRALSAADTLTDGSTNGSTDVRLAEHQQSLAVRAFYPSLHLSLAVDYANLGRSEAARSHLRRARDTVGVLGDDAYGDGVRAGIGRLELRLDEEGPSGGAPEPAPGRGPGGETLGPPRQRP